MLTFIVPQKLISTPQELVLRYEKKKMTLRMIKHPLLRNTFRLKKSDRWILCHFGGIQKFYFFFFENFEFSSYYKKLILNRSCYNLELMTLITA